MDKSFETKKALAIVYEQEFVQKVLTPVEVDKFSLFISSYADLRAQLNERLGIDHNEGDEDTEPKFEVFVNDGNPINSKKVPKGFDWLVQVIKLM